GRNIPSISMLSANSNAYFPPFPDIGPTPALSRCFHRAAGEQIHWQLDPALLDAIAAARANSVADELADCVAVAVDALLVEAEDVVHGDLLAFHAAYLADARYLSLAARQARRLHDQLDRAGDLRSQGA